MFARTVNASKLRSLVVLAILACILGTGCKWKRKKAPPAAPSTSTATTEAAALTGVPVDAVPPAAPPVPVDPLSRADHSLIDEMKAGVRELDAIVKLGALTNPAKPEAGDITTRCSFIEGGRPRLEVLSSGAATDPDGELKKLVAETRRLCSLEVPLLNANQALRQLNLSPSQASRRLMCGLAQKDVEKARSAKTNDRRVRDVEARVSAACR